MRRLLALAAPFLVGCSFQSGGLTATSGGLPDTSTGGSSSTSGASVTETGAPTTTSGATESGGPGCALGDERSCPCPNGPGTQVCDGDGVFGPCDCQGPGTTTGTTMMIDPSTTTATTTDDTISGGTTTTTGDPSTTTGSTGMDCPPDADEPNDTPMDATTEPAQVCDGAPTPGEMDGRLETPADVDWHAYFGDDNFNPQQCTPGPVKATHVLNASAPARLCVFATCADGLDVFQCSSGMMAMQDGAMGCCLAQPATMGKVEFTIDCDGTNEDSDLLVRVDMASDDCVDYTVEYTFDK